MVAAFFLHLLYKFLQSFPFNNQNQINNVTPQKFQWYL